MSKRFLILVILIVCDLSDMIERAWGTTHEEGIEQIGVSISKKPKIPALNLKAVTANRDNEEWGPLSTGRKGSSRQRVQLTSLLSARDSSGVRSETLTHPQIAQQRKNRIEESFYKVGLEAECISAESALRLFQFAAQRGHAPSIKKVGEVAYRIGLKFSGKKNPTESDYLDSLKYYELAGKHGYEPASDAIAEVNNQLGRLKREKGTQFCVNKAKVKDLKTLEADLEKLQAGALGRPSEKSSEIGIVALEIAKIKLNEEKNKEALHYLKISLKQNNEEAVGYYILLIQGDPLRLANFCRKQVGLEENKENQSLKYNYGLALQNIGLSYEALPWFENSNIHTSSENEDNFNRSKQEWTEYNEKNYLLGMKTMGELDALLSGNAFREEDIYKLIDQAELLFNLASEAGHAPSVLQLALIHELYGRREKSRELFAKLAAYGDLEGVCGLARLSESRDPVLAEKFYRKGAKLSYEGYEDLATFYLRHQRFNEAYKCKAKFYCMEAKRIRKEEKPASSTFRSDLSDLALFLYVQSYPVIDGFVFEGLEETKKIGDRSSHDYIDIYVQFEQRQQPPSEKVRRLLDYLKALNSKRQSEGDQELFSRKIQELTDYVEAPEVFAEQKQRLHSEQLDQLITSLEALFSERHPQQVQLRPSQQIQQLLSKQIQELIKDLEAQPCHKQSEQAKQLRGYLKALSFAEGLEGFKVLNSEINEAYS